MKSLPLIQTASAALHFLWDHRKQVLQATGIPLLLLMALYVLIDHLPDVLAPITWALFGAQILLFAWVGVAVHEIILVPKSPRTTDHSFSIGTTMSYGAWSTLLTICLVVGVMLVGGAVGSILVNTLPKSVTSKALWAWVLVAAGSLATYIPARWSLVLPLVALGRSEGASWSWRFTRGNGWRIALLVYILPWTFHLTMAKQVGPSSPLVLQIATTIAFTLIVLIEVALLSFTFKALTEATAD